MTSLAKNIKLNSSVSIAKRIFLCVFTFYLITREIPILDFLIDNLFITGFFFGVSMIFIAYDLLTNRYCLKTRFLIVAALFLVATTISCFINIEYGLLSNIKGLAALFIYLFLIYPDALHDSDGKTLKLILNIAHYCLLIFSLLSFPMYIFDIGYLFTQGGKGGFPFEIVRLWGLYQDPNYASLYALITIFSSIYLFLNTKSKIHKIGLVVGDIIQILYLSLANSRMGILAMFLGGTWASLVIAFKVVNKKMLYKILLFLLSVVLVGGFTWGSTIGLQKVLPYAKNKIVQSVSFETYQKFHKVYYDVYTSCKVEIEGYTPKDVTSEDYEHSCGYRNIVRESDPEDISSGRFDRWLDGIKILLEKPIFGVSPRNIFSFAKDKVNDTLMAEGDKSIHNTYIEILAGAGIIGAGIILIFLIAAAANVLKAVFAVTPTPKTILSSSIVLMIAFSAVLLPDIIFFQTTFAGLMFWLALGHCLNLDTEDYKNSLTFRLIRKIFKKEISL